ncbi:MAG: phenylalanine--tRNA ligase subunit beta [Candidatus Njordarchaeia archaeon]
MPVLDITLERINELLGKDLTLDELEEMVFQFGMELESYKESSEGLQLKIEITPDRPDMLISYGFVRAIRKYIGLDKGLEKIRLNEGEYVIYVDKKVENVRPYIGAIVVKNVNLTENDLLDLIYAQEKLHETFCRSRVKASIGLYPFDKITWPLKYTTRPPKEIVFRPLEFNIKMDAEEILRKHPTGQKYAFILEGKREYPVFLEGSGNILSLPPIINSEDYGKVTVHDRNILIEVTGTHKPTMDKVLNFLTYAFEMIGGEIYKVKVVYPNHEETYPKIDPDERVIDKEYVKKVLGIDLSDAEIVELLEKMGYDAAKLDEDKFKVLIPPYRADVLHNIDVVDDIARAYTFDKFESELTPVFTIGAYLERKYIIDRIRELLTGLGYIEAFTFALTSTSDQFEKMRLPVGKNYAEIGGSKEKKINMVRVWLIPELIKMISFNKDKKKPIQVFELSEVVELDKNFESGAKNIYHLAAITAHSGASYTEIRRVLEYILDALGKQYSFERTSHPSFIEGRIAKIIIDDAEIGVVGEIHPEVLLNWGVDFPIAAFEININKVLSWTSSELEVA